MCVGCESHVSCVQRVACVCTWLHTCLHTLLTHIAYTHADTHAYTHCLYPCQHPWLHTPTAMPTHMPTHMPTRACTHAYTHAYTHMYRPEPLHTIRILWPCSVVARSRERHWATLSRSSCHRGRPPYLALAVIGAGPPYLA